MFVDFFNIRTVSFMKFSRKVIFLTIKEHDRSAFTQRIVGTFMATTNIKIMIRADYRFDCLLVVEYKVFILHCEINDWKRIWN